MKNKKITKDMTFHKIFEVNPDAGFILMQKGLMCGGCIMAQMETLDDGCKIHGVDVNEILKELNMSNKKWVMLIIMIM